MSISIPKFLKIFTNQIFQRKPVAEILRTDEQGKTMKIFNELNEEYKIFDAVEKPVNVLGDHKIDDHGVISCTGTNTGVQEEKCECADVLNCATDNINLNHKPLDSEKNASENIDFDELVNTAEIVSNNITNLEGFRTKVDSMEKQIIRLRDKCKALNNCDKSTEMLNTDVVNRVTALEVENRKQKEILKNMSENLSECNERLVAGKSDYKSVNSSINKLIEMYDELNIKIERLGIALNIVLEQNANSFINDDMDSGREEIDEEMEMYQKMFGS